MGLVARAGTVTNDVLAPAGTVVTGNGSGVANAGYGAAREAVVQVNVTAVAGTAPSLTVNVQDTVDGTNWNTVASSSSITATGTYVIRIPVTTPFTDTIRVNYAVGGTLPSFTLGVQAYFSSAANFGV